MWLTKMDKESIGQASRVMNAIRLYKENDIKSLIYEKVKIPEISYDEALIKVHAAAITRDELSWPVDRLPAIPSYEFSGIVSEISGDVDSFKVGDSVYGLSLFSQDGAAADFVKVPINILSPKPKNLNHVESSSVPLSALSAWQGLFDYGKLKKGQKVLIHGAAGGVGHFAVQFAHNIGAYVIGTTSPANIDNVKKTGADKVLDHNSITFEKNLAKVDLVFDTVGGVRLQNSSSIIQSGGKLVSVASEPPIDKLKESNIEGIYFIVKPNNNQLKKITNLIEKGVIHPTIDKVFDLINAQKAFERSIGKHGPGKIVLKVVNDSY